MRDMSGHAWRDMSGPPWRDTECLSMERYEWPSMEGHSVALHGETLSGLSMERHSVALHGGT